MKIFKYSFLIFIITLSFVKNSYPRSNDKIILFNESVIKEDIPTINSLIDLSLIDDDVANLQDKYPEFLNLLEEARVDIPLVGKFIPQGITIVDEYFLIIGYYEDRSNSKCYILDFDGKIVNVVELDTNSHVGGITYDKAHDLIWLPCNDGVLNVYKRTDFFKNKKVKAFYKFGDVSDGLTNYIDNTKKHIAYLTIDDGYIYIGNFYKEKKCLVKKYKINFDKELKLDYVDSFYLPPKVQGITFYEANDRKYLIVSSSYNRKIPSNIFIYEYRENINDYTYYLIDSITIPPMSEQLVVKNNKLYLLFESGALKYSNAIDKVKKICVIDLDRLLY